MSTLVVVVENHRSSGKAIPCSIIEFFCIDYGSDHTFLSLIPPPSSLSNAMHQMEGILEASSSTTALRRELAETFFSPRSDGVSVDALPSSPFSLSLPKSISPPYSAPHPL
mmetsp:Transcript_3810/g.7213  ORF Transcript_3810/g.7213 Transcript_3810/m.7213 type:complete len:111 (-) Transcript_3810:466-798(-)